MPDGRLPALTVLCRELVAQRDSAYDIRALASEATAIPNGCVHGFAGHGIAVFAAGTALGNPSFNANSGSHFSVGGSSGAGRPGGWLGFVDGNRGAPLRNFLVERSPFPHNNGEGARIRVGRVRYAVGPDAATPAGLRCPRQYAVMARPANISARPPASGTAGSVPMRTPMSVPGVRYQTPSCWNQVSSAHRMHRFIGRPCHRDRLRRASHVAPVRRPASAVWRPRRGAPCAQRGFVVILSPTPAVVAASQLPVQR